MSEKPVNLSRRRFLTTATTVVGAVGAVSLTVPFIASWAPSAKAKAAGAPVDADISKLEVGALMIVEWRGRPVWIIHRSQQVLAELPKHDGVLRDPESNESVQPSYAKNEWRSIKPEYLILVGICTHLGCSPSYRPEIDGVAPGWPGGFYCMCHGSKFDLAGRVYKSVPAPTNLVVPPHKYLSDTVIRIGEDEE